VDYLIYLAGPITGLSWKDATEWRKNLINRFQDASTGNKNYIALSPLRGKEFLSNETDIKDSYSNYTMSTPKAITTRDLNDVRRCDLIIVNFLGATKVSIGTILEIGAGAALNKPIILIMDDPTELRVNHEDNASFSTTALYSEADGAYNDVQNNQYVYSFISGQLKNVHDHSMIRESVSLITPSIDEAYDLAIHLLG